MPKSFCLFQTFSFSLAAFGLSGWCSSFSIATSLAVFKPGAFDSPKAALAWHPRYIPTLIIYPVVASAVFIAVVLKLDAVDPSILEDMHCDITSPIWIRLLGYGGMSPLASIPFLVLSVASALRLYSIARQPLSEQEYTSESISSHLPSAIELQERGKPKRGSKILSSALPPFGYHSSGAGSPQSHATKYPKLGIPVIEEGKGSEENDANLLDSPVSTTMPVFASNPSLPSQAVLKKKRSTTQIYGLALTTGDNAVDESHQRELTQEKIDMQVGLALTTDEPAVANPYHEATRKPPSPFDDNYATSISSRHTPAPSIKAPSASSSALSSRRSTFRLAPYDPSMGGPLPPSSPPPTSPPPPPPASITRTYASSSVTPTPYTPSFPHPLDPPNDAPPSSRRISPIQPLTPIENPPDRYTPVQATLVSLPSSKPRRSSHQSVDHKNSYDLSYPIDVYGSGASFGHDDRDIDDTDSYDKDFDSIYKMGGPESTKRKFCRRDPMERLGVYNPTPPPTAMTEDMKWKPNRTANGKNVKLLMRAMMRMILFQIGFFVVQLLAALSTVIDVANHRLSPFGTQHIALILAAWGPMIIWGGVQILAKLQPNHTH
ncbi:hypothetical protein M422DRAFT_32996 [Sphaerobolus stellatus SS14]|uniref:Uncharacterized protein n=1 Tax=Sphaerobolus stellatus (strain SS14) TaxID=990650 RepID=A0A0C9VMP6_SPHS4|nr:hypothetical protein M422DRAFT_32996 [Sphaerobolus stellatus SS14]